MIPLAADTGFTFADEYTIGLLFLAVALFAAIGALSHQDERPFSASLIYLALGIVAALGIDAMGVRWIDPLRDEKVIEHVTEFAVAVAVFSTGLRLQRAPNRRSWGRVAVLLGVVMPLTIAAVALFGAQVMGLSLGAAVILGGILAPTDPVLAGDIGVAPPHEDEERQGEAEWDLTAEAAANDGLATPFVLLGIFIAGQGGTGFLSEWVLADVLYATLGGVALGAAGGYGVAALFVLLRDRHFLSHDLDGWAGVATALLLFAAGEAAGTYGFVAAFAGGIAFRRYEYGHEVNRRVHDGNETVEKFLELAVILLLGSLITLEGLGEPGVSGWALAFVLIFLIRPLAVAVSLVPSRLAWRERAFLAWFGVKGVASLNYAAIALGAGVLSASEESTLFWTVAVCVIVSIVVHGVSATSVSRLLLDANAGRESGGDRHGADAGPEGELTDEALAGPARA